MFYNTFSIKTIGYIGNSCKTGVYAIRNVINGKIYVGSTTRSFHSRKTKHLTSLKRGDHYNDHLQSAWNKYGEKSFVFEILDICDKDVCCTKEGFFIYHFNSNDNRFGYNKSTVSDYKFGYSVNKERVKVYSKLKNEKLKTHNGLENSERGLYKAIDVYDMSGSFIKTFNSGIDFSKEYGHGRAHTSSVLSKRKLYIKNKIILFHGDKLTRADIDLVVTSYAIKKVYIYFFNGDYVGEFSSAKIAAKFIGCKDAEVRMCCIGRRSRIRNYITKYEKIS